MATHYRQSYDDHEYEAKASPMATGSITKLHTGEGVRKFTVKPKEREKAPKAAHGVLIGVAIAALVIIVGGFLLVRALLGQAKELVEVTSDTYPTEAQQADTSVDETSGEVDYGSIEYVDETFSIVPVEGSEALVATDKNGNQRTLFVVEGTPVTFFLYDGTLIVPENLQDGWDVIAYTVDSDAVASQVVVDGSPVTGEGEITEATLSGNELVIVDSTGSTTRVSL